MGRVLWCVLSLTMAACVYVTKEEYDDYWDVDQDGWPLDQDCNDNNPDVYPFAPDRRGDGCDADCGEESDQDGDDWPDQADCEPTDPEAYPCSEFESDLDDIDHDCDGLTTIRTDPCPTDDPDFEDAPELTCGDTP